MRTTRLVSLDAWMMGDEVKATWVFDDVNKIAESAILIVSFISSQGGAWKI